MVSTSYHCMHRNVVVDYVHPRGRVPGVALHDIRALDRATTRKRVTVSNPRCADCGEGLSPRALGTRLEPGGDLYDPRFEFQ